VIKSRERNQEASSSFTEVKQKLADSIQACTADFLYLENLFIFVFPIYVFSVFKKSLSFFDHIIFSATSSFLKFLSLVVLVAYLRDKGRENTSVSSFYTAMSSHTASSSNGGNGSGDSGAPRRNSKRPKCDFFLLTPVLVVLLFLDKFMTAHL
jgi:hypothetical protein